MDDFTTIRIRRSTQARLVQVRDALRGGRSLDDAVGYLFLAWEQLQESRIAWPDPMPERVVPQRNSKSKFEGSGREDGAGQAVVDVETEAAT